MYYKLLSKLGILQYKDLTKCAGIELAEIKLYYLLFLLYRYVDLCITDFTLTNIHALEMDLI